MFAVLGTYRLDGDLSCAFVASALVLENNLEVTHVVHRAGGDEKGGVGAVEADQAALGRLNLLPIKVPGGDFAIMARREGCKQNILP